MARSPDCPICLEAFVESEHVFTLPCHTCQYNFCTRCIETFVKSSNDDYQEASDGSRQVKIHVACPQCRSDYPMDISKVLLLREALCLGTNVFDEAGQRQEDSQLSATHLTLKAGYWSHRKKRQVERAYEQYLQVTGGEVNNESQVKAAKVVIERLFAGLPKEENPEDLEESYDEDESTGGSPSRKRTVHADSTLFQGLEDCMGPDEKIFLTELMTSGDASKLAQAAMILQGILKLSLNPQKHLERLSAKAQQKSVELIEKTKRIFPLPNHMPGYFVLPLYSKEEKFIKFEDQEWDGQMVPPASSSRVFQSVYEGRYTSPREPHNAVTIRTVRGPAGRLGVRKADIVTHVNEMEWEGTAQELMDYIYNLNASHPEEELTLTVNANPETAAFLKVRRDMMEESRNELI